ncbi:MBL fold metallo-hydrolase [Candidatus Pelagibacter bacterium]|nr:MBL fold metallo-hydrolase [Candidatus Pelagibacter bacterium]
MKFEFIGNAAGIFHGSNGTKILCDPWIIDGVFEGSWFHYPPLKTKLSDLQDIDAIYVSHIHPDHFDQRHFDFPKNLPIIILDEGPNFLKKNLISLGFKNIISVKNDETINFKEFKLTLYKPFIGHKFEESLLGNLIDSALVLENKGKVVVNFNDNTPDIKGCEKLHKKFKKIDLALLNYNAAGPYPSCFENLSKEEKKSEHNRILKRNFDYLCKIIPKLNPDIVLPFAGSYILGGKNYEKNDYLGTTTWEHCARYLRENLKSKSKVICMRENQLFDLDFKNDHQYENLNLDHMKKYIETIKTHKYDYENDPEVDIKKLKSDISNASAKFQERIKKFNANLKTSIFLKIDGELKKILNGNEKDKSIICEMDTKLLRRILDKKSHWNNAEIGAHINFTRSPNKMEPDVHTCLSFFHL